MKNHRISLLAILAAVAIAGLFFIKNFSENHPPAMFFVNDKFMQVIENDSLYHIGVAQQGTLGLIEAKKNSSILIGDIDQGTEIHVLANGKFDLKVLEINNGSKIHVYLASDSPNLTNMSLQKVGNGSHIHIYCPTQITQSKIESSDQIVKYDLQVNGKKIGRAELYEGNNTLELHNISSDKIQNLFKQQKLALEQKY